MVKQEHESQEPVDFVTAFGKHFGIKSISDAKLSTGRSGGFWVDVEMFVNNDDMAAIVALMGGKPPAPTTGGPVESKQYLVMGANPPESFTPATTESKPVVINNHFSIDAVGTDGCKATIQQMGAAAARGLSTAIKRNG